MRAGSGHFRPATTVELTRAQRAEVARCHANERPHELAGRLGVSKRLVKAEIRRLRFARPASRPLVRLARSFTGVGAALALIATLGAGPKGPPRSEQARVEPEAARELYRKLDRGALTAGEAMARLEDGDPSVRLAAVRAYVRSPLPSRDPRPLLPRLNDEERIRLATIQGLGELADPRAVPALAAVAGSARGAHERGQALEALARIPDDTTIPPLTSALADATPSIRARAFELLKRRLKTTLGCDLARLEREPEVVRDVFRTYWKERGR